MPKEQWDLRDGENFSVKGIDEIEAKMEASPFELVDFVNISLKDLAVMREAMRAYTSIEPQLKDISDMVKELGKDKGVS